jgi:RNase P subunit RPR2
MDGVLLKQNTKKIICSCCKTHEFNLSLDSYKKYDIVVATCFICKQEIFLRIRKCVRI